MALAEMESKIYTGNPLVPIYTKLIKVEDGTKGGLRDALLGHSEGIYQATGELLENLTNEPLGPPDEVIQVKTEYELRSEGIRVYYTELTIECKRFMVLAAMWGMRIPLHEDIIKFIKTYFVDPPPP